jgi:hypothetical protein
MAIVIRIRLPLNLQGIDVKLDGKLPASGYITEIPSGYVKIAIENGHRNSGFSH